MNGKASAHEVPHPFGKSPEVEDSAVLWRYISFVQLAAMLDSKSLHLTRGDGFSDELEGSLTRTGVAKRRENLEASNSSGHSVDCIDGTIGRHFLQGRKYVEVSCWFAAERESAQMWKTYGQESCSVAIVTTAGQLRKMLKHQTKQPPWVHRFGIYEVSYIDYDTDLMDEMGSPFMFKSEMYSEEREVRVLRETFSPDYANPRNEPRPEFPGSGSNIRVSMSFIDRLIVAPGTAQWQKDLIQSLLERHGVKVQSEASKIEQTKPVF